MTRYFDDSMTQTNEERNFPRVKIGISSCLLGQEVRFNGGHRRDGFVCGDLARYADYVPVCPEVAIGMGIPRPPIRLTGDPGAPRAVGTDDPDRDFTERLQAYAEKTVPGLDQLSGYILKKDSPSCGMERVKVYNPKGGAGERRGTGIYAGVLTERMPLLPVEEEGRLNDPVLRENFINRVYTYRRWRELAAEGVTPAKLIAFHTDHKYLVMAHSQAAYQRLGRMLCDLSAVALNEVASRYFEELMTTLGRRVNRKRHVNVLQHMLGYLKRGIDGSDKKEIAGSIEAYCRNEVPLVVPITLLRHYFSRHPDAWMGRQVYLFPHPDDLGLRNRI